MVLGDWVKGLAKEQKTRNFKKGALKINQNYRGLVNFA